MPDMTIVLSGPQGKIGQARKALEAAHFTLIRDANGEASLHNWGHDAGKAEVFVSVEGDDVDRAASAVEPFGYRLRGHWNNDADIQVEALFGGLGNFDALSPEQRIARIESDLAILKGGK